ncbi:MAG: septal ring lytic transglycosylase RlpA family protein, partial [Halorhodospira sp.]
MTRLLTPPAPGWGAAALLLALLSGCSGPARTPPEPPGTGPSEGPGQQAPEAQPREVPLSPYGNPVSYEIAGETYYPMGRDEAEGLNQRGHASWYGEKFHGRRTSSGERYDMYAMTAAHRELPLPSWVEVTNLQNGRSAVVKVNDRGPFVDTHERIMDLSYAAASRLGIAEQGTAPVEIRVITPEGTSSEEAGDGASAEAAGALAVSDVQ